MSSRRQPTLAIQLINPPYQHTLSTYYQHTLSTHSLNTPYQQTLSTHPTNKPSQHTLSTNPLNTPYQHTLSTPSSITLYRKTPLIPLLVCSFSQVKRASLELPSSSLLTTAGGSERRSEGRSEGGGMGEGNTPCTMFREGLSLNSPFQGLASGPGLGQGHGQVRNEVGVTSIPPFPPQILDSFVASVRSRTWRMDVQTLHTRCMLLTTSPQVR